MGNLFARDHAATLSYTTSPNHIHDVTQLGAFYRIPLHRLGGILDACRVHSDVDSVTAGNVFQVSGSGRFVGLHYQDTLAALKGYEQTLSLGVEDRAFINRIDFLGRPLGSDVGSRPLGVRYRGHWQRGWGDTSVWAEYARNLPGGSNNDGRTYRAARTGASCN